MARRSTCIVQPGAAPRSTTSIGVSMRLLGFRLALARRASWISLAVAGAACNPDELTGPGDPSGIPVIDLRPLFSGFEGGTSIGIPGNNGPTAFGGVASFELFTVPKGHFFQIDVAGTISSTDSGNCDPAIGATGTWGPYGHNGSDGRVNFATSPNQGGIPTSAPGSTMTLNNIYASADVTISASRSIFWGTCLSARHRSGPPPTIASGGAQTTRSRRR